MMAVARNRLRAAAARTTGECASKGVYSDIRRIVPLRRGEKCELAGDHEVFRDITHAGIRINLDNLLTAEEPNF